MYLYLASPYSHKDNAIQILRYKLVKRFAAMLVMQKKIVYSPIVHFHPMAQKYNLPTDHQYWKDTNRALLAGAKALCIVPLPGWEVSKGLHWELRKAHKSKKRIFILQPCDKNTIQLIAYKENDTYAHLTESHK